MREYVTQAIVLDRTILGDVHERIHLFTRQLGKVTARTVSSKKIISKLSPHLEPGNLSTVRFVEKNELLIVDALKEGVVHWPPENFFLLHKLLDETEPDGDLWHQLTQKPTWPEILRLLGWDPSEAECHACGKKPVYFGLTAYTFACGSCRSSEKTGNAICLVP